MRRRVLRRFASAVVIALVGVNPLWILLGSARYRRRERRRHAFFVGRDKSVAAQSLERP